MDLLNQLPSWWPFAVVGGIIAVFFFILSKQGKDSVAPTPVSVPKVQSDVPHLKDASKSEAPAVVKPTAEEVADTLDQQATLHVNQAVAKQAEVDEHRKTADHLSRSADYVRKVADKGGN